MIQWLVSLDGPSRLPAAWLLKADDPELRHKALDLIPAPEDFARAARRPPVEREDVLVRRGLVRLCVAAALDMPAADVAILWSKTGAPLLAPPFGDYHLSWAQRRHHFACALARQQVGVDVEITDGGEIPWNVLHADEVQGLRAERSEREALFLRIWAAKEAYGKALGEGLRREPTEFAVQFAGHNEARINDPARGANDAARVIFSAVDRDAVVAVALI